jgi:hypothetical protein
VESIATKIMPRGKKNSKSKKPKVVNQTLNRSDLFQNVRTTTRPCKCKKTNCLKLYCECYRSASFCDPDLCYCIGCLNTEAHNSTEEPRGRRVLAMLVALAKKPDAFDGGGRKFNTKGCRCTKSRYVRSSINLVWLNLLVILLTPSILFNLSLIVFLKHSCASNFCECFASGKKCTELCSCHGCLNCTKKTKHKEVTMIDDLVSITPV